MLWNRLLGPLVSLIAARPMLLHDHEGPEPPSIDIVLQFSPFKISSPYRWRRLLISDHGVRSRA